MQNAVKKINIFSTVLRMTDYKIIIIPNGCIISSNIINFSKEGTRRVELVFSINYKDDLKLAKEIILAQPPKTKRYQKSPCGVGYIGESSVNLTARFWRVSGVFGMLSRARGREAQI